ncbi:MAG: hypothetical protein KA736_11410 [Crocinitomicaceae bacterium]|nr:hypothetical protein [Crocinitomicaceae bacterium]MBP6033421.1 hypothetical protein [Crocinitomicaceae bacterium]
MRSIILFLFLSLVSPYFAQSTYSMDDYFNASNPSAFAEKKVYTSNTSMYSRMQNTPNLSNFIALKQQVGSFSFGLNNEFSQWFEWKTISTTFNAAYSAKINRKLTLNTGLGLSMRRDNLTFTDNTAPPIESFTLWNPASYCLNVGVSLVSKKWTFGLAGNNLNRMELVTYPYTYKSSMTISANASYRFDLDSAKHFSLTPALFYRKGVNDQSNDFFFNLTFKAYQHSTGFCSTLNHNIGIFYQYHFKNNLTLGASVNNNYSLLSSNIFTQNYLSGMLRLSYALSSKASYKISGTPSF